MDLISIIIPVFNEAANLERILTRVKKTSDVEIIIVDGGSSDETVAIAQALDIQVIQCTTKGRAYQMNAGVEVAQGDILLFLHGDTLLPPNYEQWIKKAIAKPEIIAGAFSLQIDGNQRTLRLVETVVNWRSRFLALPYGDQGIFLKTTTFKAIGGFTEIPIMEDFDLILKLRKMGKIAIIPQPVITSARRWQKLGVFKTTIINQIVILGYFLGVAPERLAQFYLGFKD